MRHPFPSVPNGLSSSDPFPPHPFRTCIRPEGAERMRVLGTDAVGTDDGTDDSAIADGGGQ